MDTLSTGDDQVQARGLLLAAARQANDFIASRRDARVHDSRSADAFAVWLDALDFESPRDTHKLGSDLYDWLGRHAVRSDHPRYFGLFNPPALPAAIAGDLIAATVNPQLAVHSHAPAAAAIERKLLAYFGTLIGWPADSVAGTFTSGGSEANHTALLAALARRYPDWERDGVRGLPTAPAIYVSAQAHLAWIKIARVAGLGTDAVRLVPTADGLSLRGTELARFLQNENHRDPVLIVATAGTTAHGAIDDIEGIAKVARRHDTYLHVDAAWAGATLLADGAHTWLRGIERADSITVDPHKWLAVPMGAGMFLSRDWQPLERAFGVRTGYMPSASHEVRDAYIHSLQWSRRFTGLKLFTALAALGRKGYAEMIKRQVALGAYLRRELSQRGWKVLNDTTLPLVCFAPNLAPRQADEAVRRIESSVLASGGAWVSSVALRDRSVLRACITSFESTERDVDALLDLLDTARREASAVTGIAE